MHGALNIEAMSFFDDGAHGGTLVEVAARIRHQSIILEINDQRLMPMSVQHVRNLIQRHLGIATLRAGLSVMHKRLFHLYLISDWRANRAHQSLTGDLIIESFVNPRLPLMNIVGEV